jgi:hypothetical protein
MPQRLNCGPNHQAATIDAMLSSTGVAAGTRNRFQVFRIPAASDTIEIRPMYGNMICVMSTAPSKRSSPDAISQTMNGEVTTPTMQVATSIQKRIVETASISFLVTSSPSRARVSPRIGTKACWKAPSPNKRRRKLGIRNATL